MRGFLIRVVTALLVPGTALAQTAPAVVADAQPRAADDGSQKDYAQISLEELLNKDVTVAATKTRVDVGKAPVSVTVLTPDDIQRSGATALGELLRTVPGLDVLESFPGHISVSARGTSEVFVNNMLVLIDGRRLEFQAAGVPFFENAPVRLEDVKRIEVIKGPVGALYGTNALAGIISITTYSPEESQGTMASLTSGTRDTYMATLRHGGRIGTGWYYKLLGGYTYTGTWDALGTTRTASPAGVRKGDALIALQRTFSSHERLNIEAGLTKGDLASLSINTYQTRFFTWPHFRVDYGRSDFHAELTVTPQDSELREFSTLTSLPDHRAGAVNLALDRTLNPFTRTRITVGGNLRYQRSTFINIAVPHSQVIGGVFAQNEQTLVPDHLTLFGAIGLSQHPELPTQVDGNAALVFTPVPGHSFRVSAGRAHRDPSFNESFLNFPRRIGARDGLQIPNDDLRPETLRSLEGGYHGRLSWGASRLHLFGEAFVERVENLINIINRTVPPGTVPDRPTVTILQQFQNSESRDGWGFETGAEWNRSSVGLIGQYAYQSFHDHLTQAPIYRDTPRHKVSGALRLQRGGLELDVWAHAVSHTTAQEDGYLLLNPRLGFRHGNWHLGVEAFNALDDQHIETINGANVKGQTLKRAVVANLGYAVGRNGR